MSKIKICGLTRIEDIEYVNECKPDYAGFVFAKSKRQIDVKTAGILKERLDKSIKAVGVFADEDMEVVADIANRGIIELIQLHGSEEESYIAQLRQKTRTLIIKAVKVDLLKPEKIFTAADFILLDSTAGSGMTFDWDKKILCNKPVFLAGGLNAANVAKAIAKVKPFAVDVSSGVETDGYKDMDKIKKFIKESREIYE